MVLSIKSKSMEVRAAGIVLVAHPEFGMGVEFLRAARPSGPIRPNG